MWLCVGIPAFFLLLFGFNVWNKTGFLGYSVQLVTLWRGYLWFLIFTNEGAGGQFIWSWLYLDKFGGWPNLGKNMVLRRDLDGIKWLDKLSSWSLLYQTQRIEYS